MPRPQYVLCLKGIKCKAQGGNPGKNHRYAKATIPKRLHNLTLAEALILFIASTYRISLTYSEHYIGGDLT